MDLRGAAIAANRFGFGARPGELKLIASDPRGWVKSQMGSETGLPPQLAALPPGEEEIREYTRQAAARAATLGKAPPRAASTNQPAMPVRQVPIEGSEYGLRFYQTAVAARLEAAAASDRSAFERQAHFWSNHFTIGNSKALTLPLPPAFEREVIRPNVGGLFSKMLLASTQHPAMLVYLDNWVSVGPDSKVGRESAERARVQGQAGRKGLNENLGRELLELHTLGVNGGYTQADVQSLAKIITGWTFDQPKAADVVGNEVVGTRPMAALFRFDPDAHEPGTQKLLGRAYPDQGIEQGVNALNDMAHHPSTARFIATKLVRHYIADDPPPAAVERVAAAFGKSGGALRATMDAVIDSPEAWAEPFQKFKQPEEYLLSVLRALNLTTLRSGPVANSLAVMGQPVYRPGGPNGWDDRAATWLSANLIWRRMEWAHAAAQRIARADIDPIAVGESALGPLMTDATKEAIKQAQSPAQGMTILLVSPEFQRR